MNMSFGEWLQTVEEVISSQISYCSPRAWNEDHISYSWLGELTRRMPSVTIVGVPDYFKVAWDAYKADGPVEEDNGDIAILVKISFPNGASCEGVGFLEAKRRYVPNRCKNLGAIKVRRHVVGCRCNATTPHGQPCWRSSSG
jgi:hypothetical protein